MIHDDSSGCTRAWTHSQLQELQGLLEEYVSHSPKSKKADEGNRKRFRITVDLLVSDNRRRDPDGAINTIMDCLVSTNKFGLHSLPSMQLVQHASMGKGMIH